MVSTRGSGVNLTRGYSYYRAAALRSKLWAQFNRWDLAYWPVPQHNHNTREGLYRVLRAAAARSSSHTRWNGRDAREVAGSGMAGLERRRVTSGHCSEDHERLEATQPGYAAASV